MSKRILPITAILLIIAGLTIHVFSARNQKDRDIIAESAFTLLGGVRSLAVEVIWFKADYLQREGRFAEVSQLTELLVYLEPHTPEVWNYAAANFAYNIADEMTHNEDRWRWVDSAVRLLRDKALKYNPQSPDICRQLAWLYMLKMGAYSEDPCARFYREKLREQIAEIKQRDAWAEIGMKTALMRQIEQDIGFADWENPYFLAIYWAREGGLKGELAAIYFNSIRAYQRSHNMVQ